MTHVVSIGFLPIMSFSDVSVEESEISYYRYFFFGEQEVIKEELTRRTSTDTEVDIIIRSSEDILLNKDNNE